jgi:CHASE3 domain sensor protein
LQKKGEKLAAIAMVGTNLGKKMMDDLRGVVSDMKREENALLDARLISVKANDRRVLAVAASAVIVAVLGRLGAFLIQIRRRRRRRIENRKAYDPREA